MKLLKKIVEDNNSNKEPKVYMNTWKNYNENGADLSQYGINSISSGWMTIDEAREFAEKYSEDEPFINDLDNIPFDLGINEYSNVESSLDMIEKVCNLSEDEQEVLEAIMEASSDDIEEALDILDSGDYLYLEGVSDEYELGQEYVDMVGGSVKDAVGDDITSYIDEDQMKRDYEWDAREILRQRVYDDNEYDQEISDANDCEIVDVTDDMRDEYIEDNLDDFIQEMVNDDINLAEAGDLDLSDYFDYEAFGRELSFDGTFTKNGWIAVLV